MRSRRRRPWLAILACLVAAGSARSQVGAQQVLPFSAAQPSAAEPANDGVASGLDLNWRGAPISTSGSISYDLRAVRAAGEGSTLEQLITSSLSARSYIYQPWFATVNGTLGLTTGWSQGAGRDVAAANASALHERAGSRDQFVTGTGRLDLFPRSRFPFEFHVERSDSRVDDALASTLDFRTRNVGMSQRYRPISGAYNLAATFDRREQSGVGFRDLQDTLTGDLGTRWKHNELSLGLSLNEARRSVSDERTQFRTLVARHHYEPMRTLSVDTTVNWSQTEESLIAAPSDTSALQWSSVGLWQTLDAKLTLSGGVRGLLLRDAVNGHELDTLGLMLGASYELNRNARLTANGSSTTTSSSGTGSQGFSGSVGASWQADTLEFKGMRYDWFANGTGGGSSTSGAIGNESQTNLGAQLGHTLSRAWPLAAQSFLMLNGGQTLALAQNRSSHSDPLAGGERVRNLLHTAAATWNVGADTRSAYARASYSDSTELGGGHARFQLFNFQLSGNFDFDRNRSLGGDLTYQTATQRAGSFQPPVAGATVMGERTGSAGASGEITYRQQRLFGIPRLRFSSRLKLAQDVLNQPGTFATIPDRETRLWENRLDWMVGRLESQLVFRMSEVDGHRREFLMWRMQRNFGD
jgi:hypothetical protein